MLGERGPAEVRMLWAVQDSSTRVPEGAEPVLLRSREWYDALARAAWVVTNIELEPWFTRREGQEVLETYHGYPSKAMGLAQWRARGLTPTHLAADAAAYLRLLEQPAHPDPGDGPLLPRELRVRGPDHLPGLPTPGRARRPRSRGASRRDPGTARHRPAPEGRPLRPDLARRPGHQLPQRAGGAAPLGGPGRAGARTRLRDPAPRPPLPRTHPATVPRSSTSPAIPRSTT